MRVTPAVSRSIKVCGVRRPEDARACAAAGVSHAGFNRVPGTRRCVGLAAVPALLAVLGPVQPVLLYRDAPAGQILSEARDLEVTWIQLHGNEPLSLGLTLKAAGLRLIRALPDTADGKLLWDWLQLADVVLLDGPAPGSGLARPWCVPSDLDPARLWLAGGLTPANVANALRQAPVGGVDAASGLERDGQLCAQAIADFAQAVRNVAAYGSRYDT